MLLKLYLCKADFLLATVSLLQFHLVEQCLEKTKFIQTCDSFELGMIASKTLCKTVYTEQREEVHLLSVCK